jgi:hypothetical protein
MVRLEPHCKRLLDTIRIMARNAFYVALAPFKRAYNNYRDDHDYFRQLTQALAEKEHEGVQSLVLRRGRDTAAQRQMLQKTPHRPRGGHA